MSSKRKVPMQAETQQIKRPDQLGFRAPAGMAERVKRVAAEDKRTVTSWLEKVVSDALDDAEKKLRKN
jgi:hypothetical protein